MARLEDDGLTVNVLHNLSEPIRGVGPHGRNIVYSPIEEDDSSVANHHASRENLELCPYIIGHRQCDGPIAMFKYYTVAQEYLNLLIREHPDQANFYYLDGP